MATMGKYCKAYMIERFRAFSGWTENVQNVRKEKRVVEGKEVEIDRELTTDDHLYLQEDFTVTDGIFLDENVIYDNVSPDWVEFCQNILGFEVPVYETVEVN